MSKTRIVIPRELLLVEIERRCSQRECNTMTRLGLTKDEAHAYIGFECDKCQVWNKDFLSEQDVPEWWAELAVTDLYGLRPDSDFPSRTYCE